MSSIQIGKILRLDQQEVSDNAIAVLESRLHSQPRGFSVPCCLCGTVRHHPTLIDPGQIVYDRFTCQAVNKSCCAVQAGQVLAGYSLVPGSLVFAIHDPVRARFWPAIVEDSPDHFSNHVFTFHSGDNTSPIVAYFVTFINLGSWRGGWIKADSLIPFSSRFQSQVNSCLEGLKFSEAVRTCEALLKLSLRDRLLRHSFVAFAARQRGIPLPNKWILGETIGKQGMYRDFDGDEGMDWQSNPSFWSL